MVSYDGVEVCEFSSIFMISLTDSKYNPNRDDGFAVFKNTSGRNLNKLKIFLKKYLRTKV